MNAAPAPAKRPLKTLERLLSIAGLASCTDARAKASARAAYRRSRKALHVR